MSVTTYVPSWSYACVAVEPVPVAPSPKSQEYESTSITPGSEAVPAKASGLPSSAVVSAPACAVGATLRTVTWTVDVLTPPSPSETLSVAV